MPGNYVAGANIAGFIRVAEAMRAWAWSEAGANVARPRRSFDCCTPLPLFKRFAHWSAKSGASAAIP